VKPECRLYLTDNVSQASAVLKVEILYAIQPSLFENLLAEKKKQAQVFVQQFEQDIATTTSRIKDIIQEFPCIKFDSLTFRFYNEEEELKEFKARKRKKKEGDEVEEEVRKRDCGSCCLIV